MTRLEESNKKNSAISASAAMRGCTPQVFDNNLYSVATVNVPAGIQLDWSDSD